MSARSTLVASMVRVGVIGFGGGSALIPVVEKEVVERHELLDEPTFTAHTVIANVTPGALPVKLGATAGATIGTGRDAVLAAYAVALPGAAATVALLASFAAIGPGAIRYVEFAAVGITAFIIVLLVGYIGKVLRGQSRWVAVAIMVASFLVTGVNKLTALVGTLLGGAPDAHPTRLPTLSALMLIVVAILAIGVSTLVWRRPGGGVAAAAITSPGRSTRTGAGWFAGVVVASLGLGWWLLGSRGLGFLGLVAASTVSSFGGGEAYVGVADGFFVRSGMVDSATFYGQLVPVANALPGPILVKVAAGMGYSYGAAGGGVAAGVAAAVLATAVSVASCAGIALLVLGAWDRFAHSLFLQRLGRFILPVICGLLLTTVCSMVLANAEIGVRAGLPGSWLAGGTTILAGMLWWLHRRFGVHDLVLLVVGGGASLAILSLL